MRILVIGSGGREHAIAWALKKSNHQPELFIATGNPGTALLGTNLAIPENDHEGLIQFAKDASIDVTIVGTEQPLVEGLVDKFIAAGLKIVGPTAFAAQLEGSKGFAKAFMQKYQIPTATYRQFDATSFNEALQYASHQSLPLVLKADGLAAGKGVLICQTYEEVKEGLKEILLDKKFGDAGTSVVIEEFMIGEEASVFALTDGKDYVLLSPAQDHKRIGEGDTGLNTGGMGAYAPAPIVTPEVLKQVREEIIEPTLRGMQMEGAPYKGILYCGLMIHESKARVVEFNCRFGDPETQVVLPLLASDFVALLLAIAHENLSTYDIALKDASCACVILASEGYPASYEKGFPISGLSVTQDETYVFQAGTKLSGDEIVTAGGRVLGVTAWDKTLQGALNKCYIQVNQIQFKGKQFRRDIGKKGLS